MEGHGCGIPQADLPRRFEPFYRSDLARRLGLAEVGLGLAVACRIAEPHGGTSAAEAVPDGGSRFLVRLPKDPAPSAARVTPCRAEPGRPTIPTG